MTETSPVEATKICPACGSEIPAQAWLCKVCGVRQNKIMRIVIRYGVLFGVSATFLSLVTTAFALFPQAWSYLFPDPKPRIIAWNFDSPHPDGRELGDFALYNGGNVNAHVTELEFQALAPGYAGLPSARMPIFDTLLVDDSLSIKVGYPIHRQVSGTAATHYVLTEETYPIIRDHIEAENAVRPERARISMGWCFTVFPFDARLGQEAPEHREWRNTGATTLLGARVHYIDRRRPDAERVAPVRDLYMEGAVLLQPRCTAVLGGPSRVADIIDLRLSQGED